jgi:hypothetical protein
MLTPLTDLLSLDGFRAGMAFGLLATALVGLAALLGRRVLPVAGLAFGAAAVAGIDDRYGFEVEVIGALVVLAVGGYAAARRGWLLRTAASLPGAVLFVDATQLDSPGWALPAVLAVTVAGGVLAGDLDRAFAQRGLGPVLLAVTALGIYLTTPDTEHSSILLGAAVPVALLGWPRPLASLGVGGAFVAAALVGWDVVVDGIGRDGAVVGGIACLGMFAIEPVVRTAARGLATRGHARDTGPPMRDALMVAALHVVVVALCSRVAGLRESAAEALVISGAVYVAAAALLAWSYTWRPTPRQAPEPADPRAPA